MRDRTRSSRLSPSPCSHRLRNACPLSQCEPSTACLPLDPPVWLPAAPLPPAPRPRPPSLVAMTAPNLPPNPRASPLWLRGARPHRALSPQPPLQPSAPCGCAAGVSTRSSSCPSVAPPPTVCAIWPPAPPRALRLPASRLSPPQRPPPARHAPLGTMPPVAGPAPTAAPVGACSDAERASGAELPVQTAPPPPRDYASAPGPPMPPVAVPPRRRRRPRRPSWHQLPNGGRSNRPPLDPGGRHPPFPRVHRELEAAAATETPPKTVTPGGFPEGPPVGLQARSVVVFDSKARPRLSRVPRLYKTRNSD